MRICGPRGPQITQETQNITHNTQKIEPTHKYVYACKSETRDVPTNLGGTKNKAHTGTDK